MLGKEVWLVDKKFSNKNNIKKNQTLLTKQLEDILRSKTAKQWEKLAIKFEVPAARVLTLKESLGLKQNSSSSFFHTFNDLNLTVPTFI